MNEYSVAYGIGAAILIYMSYRVYVNTPKTEPKLYFTMLSTVAAIWITSEFLYYTLWGMASFIFYYVKFVGIILIPYAILMTSLTVPIRSKLMRYRYLPIILIAPDIVSLVMLFTNPLHHLFFSSFTTVNIGDGVVRYTGNWGPFAEYWHVPYSYFCLLWALIIIILNIRKSKAKLDYYFLAALFVAIVVPVIMNIVEMYVWNLYPDPTSLSIVFSAGLLTYTFSRYKLFRLPQGVQITNEVHVPEIEKGKSYIIHGVGYSLMKRLASAKPLLVISTRSARWIKEYTGKDVVVIWLSEVDSEFAILPERLEFEIEYTIIEFWRQNPGGVVLIDGVGYMKAFNSFDRLMLFLKDIIDVSSQYDGSVVVMATDMMMLEDDERNNIEGLFDEKIDMNEEVPYGVFEIVEKVPTTDALCVSSENPDKLCAEVEKKIWVRRGGTYTPETMRMETLYEIEHAFREKKELILNKPDGLFIGWKPLKIYSYIKLLADLAEKNGKKVYILDGTLSGGLRRIISMFL